MYIQKRIFAHSDNLTQRNEFYRSQHSHTRGKVRMCFHGILFNIYRFCCSTSRNIYQRNLHVNVLVITMDVLMHYTMTGRHTVSTNRLQTQSQLETRLGHKLVISVEIFVSRFIITQSISLLFLLYFLFSFFVIFILHQFCPRIRHMKEESSY